MTQYLSVALGAVEPMFGQNIQELERAGGRPSVDIRLSSEMMQKVRTKVIALGLDPEDTTGPELYQALQQRLRQDEQRVCTALGIASDASANDVIGKVHTFLNGKEVAATSFALKLSVAKRLLKKKAPRAVMKALGYRSLDSMLKHEPVAALMAAASVVESATWHKSYHDLYAKLQPGDFEQRRMTVVFPKAKRWAAFSERYIAATKRNIMSFRELGAVVVLPLPERLDGLAITTVVLSLYHMNGIRAYSSFIKLQQVKPMFGAIVRHTLGGEPMTNADLAGQPVPWRVIQRYYGRMKEAIHPDVFEPHVQAEDLRWHEAEDVLARLDPELAFWSQTEYVCALRDGQPVSLNILDVALNYCNNLHFSNRVVHYVREHLWHELMSRYLHQENLEAAVHQQLSRDLIDAQALA